MKIFKIFKRLLSRLTPPTLAILAFIYILGALIVTKHFGTGLSLETLLGLQTSTLLLLVPYFDKLIRSLREREPGITTAEIVSSLSTELVKRKKYKTIRIYALTSEMITPVFCNKDDCTFKKVKILLSDFSHADDALKNKGMQNCKMQATEWESMRYRRVVKDLDICYYCGCPDIFYVIIDESFALVGHYIHQNSNIATLGVNPVNVYAINDSTPIGNVMIRRLIDIFDVQFGHFRNLANSQ